jgi:hypothetical protein
MKASKTGRFTKTSAKRVHPNATPATPEVLENNRSGGYLSPSDPASSISQPPTEAHTLPDELQVSEDEEGFQDHEPTSRYRRGIDGWLEEDRSEEKEPTRMATTAFGLKSVEVTNYCPMIFYESA